MPTNYIKINSNWKPISKIYIKISSNWKQISQGWIKISSLWKQFFSGVDLPVIVTGPSIRLTSYSGPLAGSFEYLTTDLYGKDGTYTNYISISGRKFTKSSYLGGPRTTIVNTDLFTSGGGVTQSDRIGVDDQYLYYELTVSNGGTNTINPLSDPVKMIKEPPSHSVFTISGGSSTGSTLTVNATIANDWYRSAELATSYIRWYRGTSIGDTSGGNFRTTSLSSAQLTNTSTTYTGQDSYTTTSTDNNQYITVKLFINNSYTRTIGNNDVDGYQQAIAFTGQIQPALTAPTITSVTSGAEYGPVTVYFTGGSGPNYQLYWTTGLPDTIAPVAFDASSSSSPITDNTGPGPASSNPWFAYVRSVSSLSETSVGPSNLASDWSSGFSFNVTSVNATPPTSVSATTLSSSSIFVSWSGATLATQYRIWWSTNPSGNAVDPASNFDAQTSSTSFTFTGLASSTTFYFWVSAAGSNNVWTPYSSSPRAQATTQSPPAPVINSVTASTGGRTGTSPNFNWPNPKITWTASASNASSYRFAWSYSGGASGSGSTTQNSATFALSQPSGTTSSTLHGNMTYSCTITPYSGSGGTGTAGTAYTCATVLNSATPKVNVSV